GRYPASCPLEPGLSSPPPFREVGRPPGRLDALDSTSRFAASACQRERGSDGTRELVPHLGTQPRWPGGERPPVRPPEPELAVGVAGDAPPQLVEQAVVEGADEGKVAQVGRAAVGPG